MKLLSLGKVLRVSTDNLAIFTRDCSCLFDGTVERFKSIYGNNKRFLNKQVLDISVFDNTLFVTLKCLSRVL